MSRRMLSVSYCNLCERHHESHEVKAYHSHSGVRIIMACNNCAKTMSLSGQGCRGCDRELTTKELEKGAYCTQCLNARLHVLRTGNCPCDPSAPGGRGTVVVWDSKMRKHQHVICRRCGGERNVHQQCNPRAEW